MLAHTVTIEGEKADAPGQRDNGKTYVISPFLSYDGQEFVVYTALALAKTGIPVNQETLSTITFDMLLDPALSASMALLEPVSAMGVIDRLLTCVKYQMTPGSAPIAIPPRDGLYIQEIKTRLRLAREVWDYHRAFF